MTTLLDLDPDQLLTTTRAVRKRLDLDRPVPIELIRECIEVALQAPSGSNRQGWHFYVVSDAEKRRAIGEVYKKGFDLYRNMEVSAHALAEAESSPEDAAQMQRVVASAEYLAENMGRAPALVIPCIEGRMDQITGPMSVIANASTYGSILPAFWSFMLAARARGLGTSWTTIHLMFEQEVAELLDIPFADITQCALSPIAYTRGTDFKPARRKSAKGVVHVNGW